MIISRTHNPSENEMQVCEKVNQHEGESLVPVWIGINSYLPPVFGLQGNYFHARIA